jgi:hypothetical protein
MHLPFPPPRTTTALVTPPKKRKGPSPRRSGRSAASSRPATTPRTAATFIDEIIAGIPISAGRGNLRLEDRGPWDPAEEDWGEGEEGLPDWTQALVASGPRPMFEMEIVTPGDSADPYGDGPILLALEMRQRGDLAGARKLLVRMLEADPRCLDAHAHLGNFAFDGNVRVAISHYLQGVAIGERALGPTFGGVLPWGFIENRPFLRCLHGYGLCLWRLGLDEEAARVFARMLWLNPRDNQGARLLLDDLRQGQSWRADS